jgi:phenol 2-monooxygenase
MESLFLDSMSEHGVRVGRPYVPTSIELSENEAELKDPQAHPVKVKDGAIEVDEKLRNRHATGCTEESSSSR